MTGFLAACAVLYKKHAGTTDPRCRVGGLLAARTPGNQDSFILGFSHYAFGIAAERLFSAVAGIDTDGPGFRRIIIRPRPFAVISAAGLRTRRALSIR